MSVARICRDAGCGLTLMLAASCMAAASVGQAQWHVAERRFIPRLTGPRAISGLVRDHGNRYWAVADNGPECGLYALNIDLAAVSPAAMVKFGSCTPTVLSGACDLEAIAVDGMSGRIWTADEATQRIVAYDATSGAKVAEVAVPDLLRCCRDNLGFESLAIAAGGLEMWAATEESLPGDSSRSSYGTGTVVRLVRYLRPSVRHDFQLAGMYAYRTDGWNKRYDLGGLGRRGVADIAIDRDGSLWVLEREMSSAYPGTGMRALIGAAFYHTIYRIPNPTAATNVAEMPELDRRSYQIVVKEKVWQSGPVHANYEAICFGPDADKISRRLILASDAGDGKTIAGMLIITVFTKL